LPAGDGFFEGMGVIIRVLHEGQYELEGGALDRVNALDEQIFKAVTDRDAGRYSQLFNQALSLIREQGRPLADDDLRPSELVLPASDATLEEVYNLFQQEGLLPA
jgi:PspA-Associated protein